jgi:hypothetical protein
MHPLAVLRYCREVLSERNRRDRGHAWIWGMRHKVVVFLVSRLERDVDTSDVRDLTEAEKEIVRKSHPLLGFRSVADIEPRIREREWLADLRQRVQRYMGARTSYQ